MQNVQYAAPEVEDFDSNEPDTLFGVCQAAGEDLHINPFFLRVGLIALLFFGPWLALGAYAGLAVVVAASRFLFPKPLAAKVLQGVAIKQIAITQGEREPELIAA